MASIGLFIMAIIKILEGLNRLRGLVGERVFYVVFCLHFPNRATFQEHMAGHPKSRMLSIFARRFDSPLPE